MVRMLSNNQSEVCRGMCCVFVAASISFACDLIKVNTADSSAKWLCTLTWHFLNQRQQIYPHICPAAFRRLQTFNELEEVLPLLCKIEVLRKQQQMHADIRTQANWKKSNHVMGYFVVFSFHAGWRYREKSLDKLQGWRAGVIEWVHIVLQGLCKLSCSCLCGLLTDWGSDLLIIWFCVSH